jgi:hypothetical protein
VGDPSLWIQTSYDTRGGVNINGGTPLRKNFAGVGYLYNADLDAFISPKTIESWILDENTCQWRAPIDYPTDGRTYIWSENTISWIPVDENGMPIKVPKEKKI